jgi:acyl-CoA synthetase (NDP forming)
VIAMYTESFGNPRKFARIARRVSRQRPIVAVRTGAAAIEPSGSALYHQAGLIEVPTVTALLDTVRVLATQPVLEGPNVAVLANSRSPATLARAALTNAGLVPVDGPVALDWRSTPADYGRAVRAALSDPAIDGALVLHAPPLAEAVAGPVDEIDAAAATEDKPVVAVMLGGGDGPLRSASDVPSFSFPEAAAATLGRSYAYARWRRTDVAAEPADVATIDRAGAAKIIRAAIAREASTLDLDDAASLLAAYGIAAPTTTAAPAEDVVAAARSVGYPVAVKAQHRRVGRSAEAGIALDLVDDGDVAAATAVMRTTLGAGAEHVVVQAMVPPGLDLRVRSTDSRLGPLVAVGLGGSQADLITDEASRLAPLSSVAAEALIAGSRVGPAMDRAGLDAAPVADLLVRVAQLALDHREITLVDLNPVILSAEEAWVTDAVIAVHPVERAEPPIRRLN